MHLEDSHGPAQEGVVVAPTNASHVDQVLLAMETPRDWGGQRLVHVIDQEADSVVHYRHWNKTGHRFLSHSDDRRVLCNGL